MHSACFELWAQYISVKIPISTAETSIHIHHFFVSMDCKGWNPVRKRLNPEAIPTIFNWQQPKTPRRSLQRKVMTSVPQTSTARIGTTTGYLKYMNK
jgi:hypothetical protein